MLSVKTTRSLHHTTLHVSSGHVNACCLWSSQPSPSPTQGRHFYCSEEEYIEQKHFLRWFQQRWSLDTGRVSVPFPQSVPTDTCSGEVTRCVGPRHDDKQPLFVLFWNLFVVKFKTILNFFFQVKFCSKIHAK